ncbi:protein CURVATURE THYLAKOID 1B, chloroplastic-like isoform X2 [Hibiscus syriacus]|uniref:protein CURVATURE THYLAKOID 1B, chloroplastic-like isoform X2 n=1 Tax=Hibiscus syriacus TaxID=106335 RepID=UPI0019238DCF|nr:protein CURVATURE THYLAKOID 1B, chloroplastic-like isoform X2 [Hibiscus syriacus]
MASASSKALSIPSSSILVDAKAPRQSTTASPPCVTLPPPPVQSQSRARKTTAYCRKIARNMMVMATGEALAAREAPVELVPAELPEFIKTLQKTWDRVEDKYAVSTLAVSGLVAVVGSAGLVSAIDRLPLIPGLMEAVGIGFSGYFAYKYLLFKPDRDALLKKVKETFKEILGIS